MKEAAEQGGSGEKIERKWLISLLYHPVDEVRSLSQDQLDRIIEEYPIIGRVYDAVTGFKGALFGKKEAELDKWAEETEALEIDELKSFINGIKRDSTAVKNAIRLDYNNGLAEGSVNSLVDKRLTPQAGLSSKMCKFIFFPYRQFSELPVLYARINTVHT